VLALLLLQRCVQDFRCSERMLWLLPLQVICAGVDVMKIGWAAAGVVAVRAT
jgi:hypothetical protein